MIHSSHYYAWTSKDLPFPCWKERSLQLLSRVIEGPFFTLIRSLTPPLGANFLCQYVFMLPHWEGQKVELLEGEPEVFFPILCFCHISPLIFSIKWDLLAPKEQINPYWSRKENPSFFVFFVVYNVVQKDIKRKVCTESNATSKDLRTWK